MQAAPGLVIDAVSPGLFQPLRLEAPGSGWCCLLGPSGVGKSTLLRLVAGLETGVPVQGQARASDGAPLAGRVALMAQSDLLLPWLDVMGNVTLGARLRGQRADEAAARRLLDRLGIGALAGRRPAQLSGGQRQRAALARTLLEDRPVVLLDEPFSALDAPLKAEMQELFAETLRGRTVLHVTHDPAEAVRLADRIAVLSPAGLESVPPPPGTAPRDPATAEVAAAQAALLDRLRAAA
jgi:putative hydroxymethylpyrimidine transport system ATP-binding protein